MSATDVAEIAPHHRPRVWWRLVVVASFLYTLALVSHYFLLWSPIGSRLAWIVAEILLVAFAVFATARDITVARERRLLQRRERLAAMAAILILLLWLAGLLLTPTLPDTANALGVIIGLLIVIPVVPVAALAVPGTLLFRRTESDAASVTPPLLSGP